MPTTKLFLSYARANAREAQRLYRDLRRSTRHEIWFDRLSLLPGVRWEPAIRKAIRESRYFLALLSSSSVSERGYRHSELRQALEVLAEYPADQIYLIPIRLDDCRMPDTVLDSLNRVDLFPKWGEGVRSIVRAVGEGQSRNVPEPRRSPVPTQFRVALLGLGVSEKVLRQVADGLNSVQQFFVFTVPSAAVHRRAAKKAKTVVGGRPHLLVDRVRDTFFDQSRYLAVDLIACFTDKPLAFIEDGNLHYNYFSVPTGPQKRFLFLSSDLLSDMTAVVGQTLTDGLAYLLVGILVDFFTDTGYHVETRDCPLDHCGNRLDIAYGLNARRLCNRCSKSIKTPGLRPAIQAMLKWRAD